MKRIIFIAVLMLIVMAFGGCQSKKSSDILDFDASQVESVDIYCGSMPNDVSKKRVTISNDIDTIVQSFSKMRVWRTAKEGDGAEDGNDINMCFKLNDGSEKLIMVNGQVVSCDLGNYYVSGNMFDVVFYNSLRYPEEPVEGIDMPLVQLQKDPEKLNVNQRIQGLRIDVGSYGKNFLQYIRNTYFSHPL